MLIISAKCPMIFVDVGIFPVNDDFQMSTLHQGNIKGKRGKSSNFFKVTRKSSFFFKKQNGINKKIQSL